MARRRLSQATRTRRNQAKLLTAASYALNLESKEDAQVQRKVRQNWQIQAWTYYDSIPELGFAIEFTAHCASRMRVFVAALPLTGETGTPIDIHNVDAFGTAAPPPAVIAACDNALRDLGNGRLELAKMMERLSIQMTVAGEGFLLGVTDPVSGETHYSVRSISEIVVNDDQIELREGPMTNQGVMGLIELAPDTLVTRLWNPHPQYGLLAQSRMRALLDTCEDLMILRRMIRAIGRNRLAGRGLLLVPSEADLPLFNDDDDSIAGAPWYDELTTGMITPIRNEGDASAVVPFVTEMAGDAIAKVRWIEFTANFDENAGKIRSELLDTLATGLDLPKEAITGMADLNHWTAWAVDANTFRYHIEPHVKKLVDLLTTGFLRDYFVTAEGIDEATAAEWAPRIMFWYDPTELVTPPDLSDAAFKAHALLAISDEALRRYAGFTDADAPTPEEIEVRMVRNTRNWPANLLMALMHEANPELAVPPMAGPPAIPGIKPASAENEGGVETLPPAPTPAPVDTAPPTASAPSTPIDTTTPPGPPPMPVISSGAPQRQRFAWQMAMLDRELRARLQVAANDEMKRQLEKVGGRLRTKVAKNATLRNKIAMTHNEHVAMMLGEQVVKASGVLAAGRLQTEWEDLRAKFLSWTGAAQRRAIDAAAKLAGVPQDDETLTAAQSANDANLSAGWDVLKSSLDALAANLLHNPNPNLTEDEAIAALNPDTLVPTGVVRCAVGVAGGSPLSAWKDAVYNGATVPAVPSTVSVGGVATGTTVQNFLTTAGQQITGYEWVHGPSDKPFEPHLDLDGLVFTSFTDPALQNTTGFPDNDYYLPGDHAGCLCDVTVEYSGS